MVGIAFLDGVKDDVIPFLLDVRGVEDGGKCEGRFIGEFLEFVGRFTELEALGWD